MAEAPDADAEGAARTFSAREIVEEFFPATPARLIPGKKRLRLLRSNSGNLKLLDADGRELLVMEPVSQLGDPSHRLCCDLCLNSAGRPLTWPFTACRSQALTGAAGAM